MEVINLNELKHLLINPPIYLKVSGTGLKNIMSLIDTMTVYYVAERKLEIVRDGQKKI